MLALIANGKFVPFSGTLKKLSAFIKRQPLIDFNCEKCGKDTSKEGFYNGSNKTLCLPCGGTKHLARPTK